MIGEQGKPSGIMLDEYFGKPHSVKQYTDADDLLHKVHALVVEAINAGAFEWTRDPDTGNCISGARGGDGDGGFRTLASTTGAPNSSHKEAKAVDVYDPGNRLDEWLNDFESDAGNTMLEAHGLYREHPSVTNTWCHLTTRAPGSGKRTFMP